MSLKRTLAISVFLFTLLSLFLVFQHEYYHINNISTNAKSHKNIDQRSNNNKHIVSQKNNVILYQLTLHDIWSSLRYFFLEPYYNPNKTQKEVKPSIPGIDSIIESNKAQKQNDNKLKILKENIKFEKGIPKFDSIEIFHRNISLIDNQNQYHTKSPVLTTSTSKMTFENEIENNRMSKNHSNNSSRRGILICNGSQVDSEIIYWKIIPKDIEFESPITPHHNEHHDKYLTFEYDHGGWNNVRMGIESLVVVAHAIGRTIVFPPQQHLYLLDKKHKDEKDEKAHAVMGFEDFYDIDLLKSHKGLHAMEMKEFLEKEAITGNLKGIIPPSNDTSITGGELWSYLHKVADMRPQWQGQFVVFPNSSNDFDMKKGFQSENVMKRMKYFGGERKYVLYDKNLQDAKLIHFLGSEGSRVLQHHYAFAFFADSSMQSFYRRFIRDYMRYKDDIQCVGAQLVAAVRADSLKLNPSGGGVYYALHIRRGDMAHRVVKLQASEIIANLHYPNGSAMIPKGALVYLSTDDPKGICEGCTNTRKSCDLYPSPKPEGCPEDPSWNAFIEAGWNIRFLHNYIASGLVSPQTNPNIFGMIESIVCSRAILFAGSYWSTFTGYIHRLRGYHGLGEETYYHYKPYTFTLQVPREKVRNPYGWWREWRAGWTDDEGRLIQ
eukprot:gene9771-13143_t